MESKIFLFGIVILLLGLTIESSAQYWQVGPQYSQGYTTYQKPQQSGYRRPARRYYQQQPQVAVSQAEWVCKNPKTGDMMIIASEEVPQGSGGQWPNYPQQQPGYPQNQPNYPQTQPQYPQTQPQYPQTQPQYPQSQPNYPQTQPNYPQSQPNYPPTKPTFPNYPNQVSTEAPNTNGEGMIDIRLGNQ